MKTPLRLLVTPALLLLALVALPGALHAQATKIFVASYGNDANDGSRGSPKRNFQAAHDTVEANGQIVVLDTAGYGALFITKSLAITVPPGVNGFVTVPLGAFSAIGINAAENDNVTLRGLIIEGAANRTTVTPNLNYGIRVSSVGTLTVEDCTIRNFYDGLVFTPGGTAGINTSHVLFVHNTNVRNCRYGVDVEAAPENLHYAYLDNCRLENNGDSLYAGSDSARSEVTVDTCLFGNNNIGIHAVTRSTVQLYNCTFLRGANDLPTQIDGANAEILTFGNNRLSRGVVTITGNAQGKF